MAHEIESTDNLLSVRKMPWHGLGVVLDDYPTREEAQKIAHPWEPVEQPLFRRVLKIDDGGEPIDGFEEVEGSKVIERSDNSDVIGVTSDTLGLITNNEMWDVAEAVGEMGTDVMIETAGSMRGGSSVWILLRMAEPFRVKGDDLGDTLSLFSLQNSHDGSGSFRGQAHNTRIVCANTSRMADMQAKRTGHEFRFRHSTKVGERIEEAKAAVAMWRTEVDVWQNTMEQLLKVDVTEEQVIEFVERFQPMPPEHLTTDRVRNNVLKARGELRYVIEGRGGTMAEGVGHTAYGLLQGSVEWSQHYRTSRGKDNRARMENHFRRAVLTDDGLQRSTFQLVREVAGV